MREKLRKYLKTNLCKSEAACRKWLIFGPKCVRLDFLYSLKVLKHDLQLKIGMKRWQLEAGAVIRELHSSAEKLSYFPRDDFWFYNVLQICSYICID
jgi:hypothetical protein